jgi:hypothetical protein
MYGVRFNETWRRNYTTVPSKTISPELINKLLNTPKPHTLVSYVRSNQYTHYYLQNHHDSFTDIRQAISVNKHLKVHYSSGNELYNNIPNISKKIESWFHTYNCMNQKNVSLTLAHELNCLTSIFHLNEKSSILGTLYDKTRGSRIITKIQAQPDIVLTSDKVIINAKSFDLGFDVKNSKINLEPENKFYVCSDSQYQKALEIYKTRQLMNSTWNEDKEALWKTFIETKDFETQTEILFNNLYVWGPHKLPPLKYPNNFNYQHFKMEHSDDFNQAIDKTQQLSELLRNKGFAELKKGTLPNQKL